jgi:hypothetical protein
MLLAPPVLAPNTLEEGGLPAGVVEGLLKLHDCSAVVAAGVADPKRFEEEVAGLGVLKIEGWADEVEVEVDCWPNRLGGGLLLLPLLLPPLAV